MMLTKAIPAVEKVIKNFSNGERMRPICVDYAFSLAEKGIPPCAFVCYGIPAALQFSQGDVNKFRVYLGKLKELAQNLNNLQCPEGFKTIIVWDTFAFGLAHDSNKFIIHQSVEEGIKVLATLANIWVKKYESLWRKYHESWEGLFRKTYSEFIDLVLGDKRLLSEANANPSALSQKLSHKEVSSFVGYSVENREREVEFGEPDEVATHDFCSCGGSGTEASYRYGDEWYPFELSGVKVTEIVTEKIPQFETIPVLSLDNLIKEARSFSGERMGAGLEIGNGSSPMVKSCFLADSPVKQDKIGYRAVQIDYCSISQNSLPVFWNNLKVLGKSGEFGRYLDSVFIKRNISPQFHEDICMGETKGVDIYIGNHISEIDFRREGWNVSRLNLGAKSLPDGFHPCHPSLHRLTRNKVIRYAFSGIDSNKDLNHFLSVLKFLEFPLKKIRIVNDGTFNLREVYARELTGKFTGMLNAIIGLSSVINSAVQILQRKDWKIKEKDCGVTYEYLVLQRENSVIIVAYIDAMAGDAAAVFMDELYSQGVQNFVFWGTTGGLCEGQNYLDSVVPTRLYHMDSEGAIDIPSDRVRFSEQSNQHYGEILNDYTLFFPVTAYIAELEKKHDAKMNFVSVEMELYRIIEWMWSRSDARLDIYLNISDSIKHNYEALLSDTEREKILTSVVAARTEEILRRMEDEGASSPVSENIVQKVKIGLDEGGKLSASLPQNTLP
ncbi:MAG: hypothetical protein KJ629_00635, partial [Candidatus Omnitrophica bacterium]|nr:hypothetical protein [Candidatus Omnitrophota bacterium]